MKKTSKLLLLFLLVLGIYSCKDDDEVKAPDYFDPVKPDSVFFQNVAGEQTINLNTNLFVTPEVSTEAAEWCEVDFFPIPPRIIIKVKANPLGESRETTVKLTTDQIQHTLFIRQLGQLPAVQFYHDTYRVNVSDTCLKIPFVANITPEAHPMASWMTIQNITHGHHTDTLILNISASREIRRLGDIEISYPVGQKQLLHIIQQSSDTTYEATTPDGLITKMPIVRAEATALTVQYGEVEEAFDGDSNTEWRGGNENFPVDFTCYFGNVERIDKMIYQAGYAYGPLQQFEIYYKSQDTPEFQKYNGTFDFQGKTGSQQIIFKEAILQPEAIRLHILNGKSSGGKQFVTIAELEFYAYATEQNEIFTDATCSALKEGVSIDQIMAMENEFLRNIARHLYSGTYDTEFRVQEYKPYIETDIQATNHRALAWSFLDNPTGIFVKKGEPVVLFVGDMHGETLKATVANWQTETYHTLKPSMTNYTLDEGLNTITPEKDGLLYLLYNVFDLNGKQPIKVHIASGSINGYFDIEHHNNEYWHQLLANRAKSPFLDVKGKLSHLVFPTEDFRTICPENIERVIEVFDTIVKLEHQLSGLYVNNRMYPNRILCKVTYEPNSYMYAYDYQTAYINTSVPTILNVENLRKDVWGVAHELGHVHQTRDIKWRGMTEVSNNVFALYVQTTFGSTSRLIQEDRYNEAYNRIAIPKLPYAMPGETDTPFAKVVPLWQLQLYFDKVANLPDFYKELYEAMRTEATPEVPQLNFVELCCRIGKLDFSDFFSFYNFFEPLDGYIEDSVNPGRASISQAQIDKSIENIRQMQLTRKAPAIQYLTDENIEVFRRNKAIAEGTSTLEGNKLKLTNWQNVAAYEVYLGDQLIQISLTPEFTLKDNATNVEVKAIAADGTSVKVNF